MWSCEVWEHLICSAVVMARQTAFHMSAELPASRKIKSTTRTLFQNFVWHRNCSISHTNWYVFQLIGIIYLHLLHPNSLAVKHLLFVFQFRFFFSAGCVRWSMWARRVWGRYKRKGRRGGKSTGGPGWGHGHTCCSRLVIYCTEPRQQSVEFKEICNEKFLIQKPKASDEARLLPPSLLHAINTYIRLIKPLDQAMSSVCAIASVKTSQSAQSSVKKGKCWESWTTLKTSLNKHGCTS